MYYVVFHGKFRDSKDVEHHVHESPMNMTLPLLVLAVLSIFGGLIDLPGLLLKGNMTHYLDNLLNNGVLGLNNIEAHHIEVGIAFTLMTVATVICLVALLLSDIVYRKKAVVPQADDQYTGWEKVSNKKLYWDEMYDFLFVKPIEAISKAFYLLIDVVIVSGFFKGIAQTVVSSGDLVRKWQTGKVNSYILWMVVGIVGFITYFLIKI
jgi:NADH-quinone oxidoreductase subunit L